MVTPLGEIGKGAELSIEELERQIGAIEQPYARSSAGRHLARHYVAQGDYGKAVAYYREALWAEGLSDIANREMLRELAQVYLLQKDYTTAVQTLEQALVFDLVPEVADYLLLAQAYYRMGKYVNVVATLDKIEEQGLSLATAQMEQALALYYRAGAFAQCEGLLRSLLQAQPDNPRHWHLLVSVYLQQDKKRQALDQLALARQKSVPFSDSEIRLLADLYALNSNPFGAAQTLEDALAAQELEATGENYRTLFEFWFQARELDRAQEALARAATLSGDTELYLYLAQLQMEQQAWQGMYKTMVAACADQLADRYVGRANLLLGVSQLKLGDEPGARRSFINATLVGGVNAKARQWLDFMQAAPVTEQEVRRIVGICFGAQDKRLKVAATGPALEPRSSGEGEAEYSQPLQIKTVPPVRLFYAQYSEPLSAMAGSLRSRVVRMNVSLVKAGGEAEGSVHILFPDGLPSADDRVNWQLGLPVRGSISASGRYRTRTTGVFRCAYRVFEGSAEDLPTLLTQFASRVQASNHQLTGEGRLIVLEPGEGAAMRLELQLGIR